MAINLELDLNEILPKLFDNIFGVCFFFIITLIIAIYYIAKSGLIAQVRNYLEYRRKSEQDRLRNQENLLSNSFFEEIKPKLEYHINIEKIQNFLNFKHPDKDLLSYIISCRDKESAIYYYRSSVSYLEKDQATKAYKLKPKYKNWRISVYYWIGTIQYFVLTFASLLPTFWFFYHTLEPVPGLNISPYKFLLFQITLLFFSICTGLFFLNLLSKPWKAKKFLVLEKV